MTKRLKAVIGGFLTVLLIVILWAGLSVPTKKSTVGDFPVPKQAIEKTIYTDNDVTYTYNGWLTRYKMKLERTDWKLTSESETEWVFEKNGKKVKVATLPDGFHLEKVQTETAQKPFSTDGE
ncbi:hypothetical protein [Rossellomorea marisflavi]|uniref:hypothetical protein n=1 Tax=Rossellomorea marisflavi TaxID=189381 RepID=UPI003FA18FAE